MSGNGDEFTLELYGGDVVLRRTRDHIYWVEKAPGVAEGFPVQVYGGSSIAGVIQNPNPLIWWSAGQAADEFKLQMLMQREKWRRAVEAAGNDPKEAVPSMVLDEIWIDQAAEQMRTAHQRAVKGAASLGTHVHAWVCNKLTGMEPDPMANEEARRHCDDFMGWAERVGLKPLENERMVLSLEHGYAGTLDMIAEVEGRVSLIDMKVSSGIYEGAYVQTAGYREAYLEEMRHVGTPKAELDRWVVCMNKKSGKVETKKMPHHERDFQAFLGALAVYKWINWRRDKCPDQGSHFQSLAEETPEKAAASIFDNPLIQEAFLS